MPSPTSPIPATHQLRSGTAARLAGLPVTTLRVWERRYGVVAADRSDGGQRVYSAHDVSRLRLLRQLTHAGHPIGTIATLPLDALQAIADEAPPMASPSHEAEMAAVVVGRSAAHALERVPGLVLRALHDDLDQAETAAVPDGDIDLLLVRLASLQPQAVTRVLALGRALAAGRLLVLYTFGTDASARALRDAGAIVRREPLSGRDLAQWVHGAKAALPATDAPWRIERRRFSDDQLTRLAETPSPVACECLRHMTEVVSLLAGFERYSQECASSGPADAALHRHLHLTAGAARTRFEHALQRVVDSERLAV